ncbi:MAG: DUF4301 family protein [Bacteroidales bacterium]|nr:DUF4301 family protein [Bacteroidales bacterium]
MFNQKDLLQIKSKGISLDVINRQIKYFRSGFPSTDIIMPATPSNGIMMLTDGDEKHFREIFEGNSSEFKIIRFIPASGAATRMFKLLFEALEELRHLSPQEQDNLVLGNEQLKIFFEELKEYPFYSDLKLSGSETPAEIISRLVTDDLLDYGSLPKGLIKFHKYQKASRTPLEEHLREALAYCRNKNGIVYLHLTVSKEHESKFKALVKEIVPALEEETGLHFDISFSFQKEQTDTIAVDLNNDPFRNPDGSLLFRPGGHGALIENLNSIQSDIIFISNIDNVAPDRSKELRIHYKKVLGGILMEVRSKIFYYIRQLNEGASIESDKLRAMVSFLHERMGIAVPDKLLSWDISEQRKWLVQKMDRPIRVCGMVKNEGEPGGGPFYVRSENGEISLQIVESSQIDLQNPEKKEIFNKSSHFNPVDIVCSTKNYKGEKYNLADFIDQNTGFISRKSLYGRDLKALELPGLWNGAMAGWLTLFVDVPVETFSPVKTIFDLRRKEHIA